MLRQPVIATCYKHRANLTGGQQPNTWFIQTYEYKIQGLFKDFSRSFCRFSRSISELKKSYFTNVFTVN